MRYSGIYNDFFYTEETGTDLEAHYHAQLQKIEIQGTINKIKTGLKQNKTKNKIKLKNDKIKNKRWRGR